MMLRNQEVKIMIVTVTMNPAIDKTIDMRKTMKDDSTPTKSIILDAGGKGINVSKTIKALGGNSVAIGFCGGENGAKFLGLLAEYELDIDFVEIGGETRVNTKVIEMDGTVTEENQAGPYVSEDELTEFMDKLMQYASENTWYILSGSVPPGIPKTIYRNIIEKVHEKGANVFLDADGELFAQGLEAKPDIVKPNRDEMECYVGMADSLTEEQLLLTGNNFLKRGIKTVIISLGGEGAIFMSEESILRYSAVPVKAHSTVGAGDAMVAAFLYGVMQGYTFEQCAKLSIATSAGAVITEGTKPPKREAIEELLQKIPSKDSFEIFSE